MDLLLAEELLLLAYRSNGSPLVELESLDYLLSAAVLAELAVRGRLALRDGRLEATGSEPVGDAELDRTLGRLTAVEQAPEFGDYWTSIYTPDRRARLLERLAERGAITHEKRSVLS
ncbi:GPP34 family phosphoprotein [Nonomuraea polychroma]|uniref:GPP34 family phosphoprotein n=1 Tax=Nonomuraea polychroma TaxID=46176 RepID=UPI000FDDFAC5|nr:GPP34 family phosphoprotein [Nonomuraea polychroma]